MVTCTKCGKKLPSKDYKTLSRMCEDCGFLIPMPFCMKCYRKSLRAHRGTINKRRVGR